MTEASQMKVKTIGIDLVPASRFKPTGFEPVVV